MPMSGESHAAVGRSSARFWLDQPRPGSGCGVGQLPGAEFPVGRAAAKYPAADVKVGPDHDVMEEILSQLIDLGAVHLPQDERDAKLEPVTQGVS